MCLLKSAGVFAHFLKVYNQLQEKLVNTSYAMLSSGVPWNMPRVTCIFLIHTSLYYFIPCQNLRKTYGNFGKSSEISANFRKLRKRFKPVFEELKRFMKLLENFGNSSKVFSRRFCDLLKFSENLRKCSEVFGNSLKVIFKCFTIF